MVMSSMQKVKVWSFNSVSKIKRTLNGHLEILNLFSCVDSFHLFAVLALAKIFQHSKRNDPKSKLFSSFFTTDIKRTLHLCLLI